MLLLVGSTYELARTVYRTRASAQNNDRNSQRWKPARLAPPPCWQHSSHLFQVAIAVVCTTFIPSLARTIVSMMTSPPEPVVVSPTEEEDLSDKVDLEQTQSSQPVFLLGSISTADCRFAKVVGIRFYRGVAHPGEYVTLVREPHNPYDRNAVRVDNLRGEKVGHIKRELAVDVARIMDQHGDSITIDASIPGIGNAYEHPLKLVFYGPEHLEPFVQASFQGITTYKGTGSKRTSPSTMASFSSGSKIPGVVVDTRSVDWKIAQQHLDEMFAKQVEGQLQNLPQVDAPPALCSALLDHQRDGMRWMIQQETPKEDGTMPFYRTTQENGRTVWLCDITQASQPNKPEHVRGGILADDMGLGKTLQTIALVLAHPPKGRDYTQPIVNAPSAAVVTIKDDDDDDDDKKPQSFARPTKTAVQKVKLTLLQAVLRAANVSNPPLGGKKADLVQAVMAALDSGSLSLEVYHTTIQQQMQLENSRSTSTGTSSTVANTTLIVCPLSVMSNWQTQIDQHVAPHTLRVAVYHGTDRKKLITQLDQIDVLISSYGTLQTDYIHDICKNDEVTEPAAKRFKQHSIFHTNFHRVVLDEAHIVRNPKSRTFQACNCLQAIHRWCLTGTPLQNKPEDVQSLWQFLRVPPLGDAHIFRRAISQPIKEGQDEGLSRLRAMMAHVALRRNKDMVTIQMAHKDIQIRTVVATLENRHVQIHDTLFRSAKLAFSATLQGGDERVLTQTGSVFEVLTRLRQACCSGSLIPKERLQRAEDVLRAIDSKRQHLSAEEGLKFLEMLKGALEEGEDGPPDCAVCFEPLTETTAVALRACGHVFCQGCIGRVAQTSGHCPFCRHSFGENDLVAWTAASNAATTPDDDNGAALALSQHMDQLGPSPKMEALIVALGEMLPGEKAVIFSQFTKFLDEIQPFLAHHGYSVTRIDGKKTANQRLDALNIFSREDGPTIMLCSLHAAGTGINLTRANHVFMMDTWFNLSVEQQAMDRVHRIGQTRPVRILRFVTADSVESRMLSLQEAKAALGKGAFENLNAQEKKKARLEDVKKLLQLCDT